MTVLPGVPSFFNLGLPKIFFIPRLLRMSSSPASEYISPASDITFASDESAPGYESALSEAGAFCTGFVLARYYWLRTTLPLQEPGLVLVEYSYYYCGTTGYVLRVVRLQYM